MKALIAKIHVAKDQQKLDDTAYQALLFRVTGKTSCSDLTRMQMIKVIKEFERLGWRDNSGKSPAKTASGQYAPILKALWISAYNLGVARSRDDKALIAFVKRQTGLSHTRFLTEPGNAKQAIEALKKWLTRDAGVEWPGKGVLETKRAIVKAQWQRLVTLGAVKISRGVDDDDGLAEYIGKASRNNSRFFGHIDDPRITADDLDRTQSALGRWVRTVIAKQGKAT